MPAFIDLSGTTLPGLTVLRRVDKPGDGYGSPMYECMKDDGSVIVRSGRNIRARMSNFRKIEGNRLTEHGVGADGAIVRSVTDDQGLILKNILILHAPNGRIDLDATYNKGCFYKNTGVERPAMCFDIEPLYDFVQKADARSLPVPDGSVSCAVFDPPFLATANKASKMSERYGAYSRMDELYDLYRDAIREYHRFLKPGGIMIFKCQDVSWRDRQYFSHVFVMNEAEKAGFYPKDLFVYATKARPVNRKQVEKQTFAKRYHSYFWVFEKRKR